MLAAVGSLAGALWLLAHRRAAPDHVLLLMLGVWMPLLMIGFIKWNIPSRYAAAQVVPLLVAGFAAMQWGVTSLAKQVRADTAALVPGSSTEGHVGSAVLGAGDCPVGSPVGGQPAGCMSWLRWIPATRVATPTTRVPRSSSPSARTRARGDIIVAEDVLQQTYYLGHVDYWLVNKQVAAPFMHQVNGRWLDFYTDTPLIGTGSELEQLVERPDRGAIYVIGSGENQEDGRSLMRAFGIAQELHSPPFHRVYRGRDGVTEVWKVDPPGAHRLHEGH